jgi:hypothetical protein
MIANPASTWVRDVSLSLCLISTLFSTTIIGAAAEQLPPLPKGVTELKFSEFFVSPIGPRGLELTEKLKTLDGKRVRILGYMVAQDDAAPGSFLLTPVPVHLHDHDSALADDLPATTVRVSVPGAPAIGHTRQLLLLTGTLSVGNRPEPDGRVSVVRLTLDPKQHVGRGPKSKSNDQTGTKKYGRQIW